MQTLQLTFTALLLAHLLADFPLQSTWMVRNKGRRHWVLAYHGFVHWVLAWVCLLLFTSTHLLSWYNEALLAGYVAVHLLIDKLKCRLSARGIGENGALAFAVDQALHVLTAAAAALALTGNISGLLAEVAGALVAARLHLLEIVTVYLAVVSLGGHLIRYVTRGFRQSIEQEGGSGGSATELELKNAGLYIGYLERLLILTAILTKSATLVGLILTGKSIARFPEFKKPSFAEYFLIGTLLSVLIAVLGGLLLQKMLYGAVDFR